MRSLVARATSPLPHRILIGPEHRGDLLHSDSVHEYRLNVDLPKSACALEAGE